jgi:hypothetical protein
VLRQLPVFERIPLSAIKKIIKADRTLKRRQRSRPKRRMAVKKGVALRSPRRGDLDELNAVPSVS